jgi:FkbM family methyltransferase
MFKSQYKQDQIVYNELFKNKKQGFFVEIGASDGITLSNSYFFEKTLNWDGICIEPRNVMFEKLIKNRNCKCYNVALSDKEEILPFMNIKGPGNLSGLVKNYDNQHKKRIERDMNKPNSQGYEIINVNTVKLSTILEDENITHIDFLSIDTEGSELDILKTVDFNKVNINVILIEDNYNDPNIMKFFEERGYNFLKQIVIDKLFKKI